MTCRLALASDGLESNVVPILAFNVPAGMVLMRLPETLEVTAAVTVHEPGVPPWAGTVPPINDRVVPIVVTVPPQLFVILAGFAKYKPAGNVSVQAYGSVARIRGNKFGL